MNADLSLGCVRGESIRCPFHEWEFDGATGRCTRIPAAKNIPDFARQTAYPTAVHGGHVFFFNRPHAIFDAPFFAERLPDELLSAQPFDFDVDVPWYMASSNGFDLQHFRAAHDRALIDEPIIEQPSPFAQSITAIFGVTGTGWMDRLTRTFSGPQVTMTVVSWSGTMVLVTARFQRTTSYGMVCITPRSPTTSRLRFIVWVPRSRGAVARAVVDPIDAAVRRVFIRAFLTADKTRTAGIRYNRAGLIDADVALVNYFDWLATTVRGDSF